jgi:hypothetical protein
MPKLKKSYKQYAFLNSFTPRGISHSNSSAQVIFRMRLVEGNAIYVVTLNEPL